jgi:hypothetical protein
MTRKLTLGGKVPIPVGKNSRQEFLPSRHALDSLTKGDNIQRSFGMYAKRTPSGLGAPRTYAEIQAMGVPKRNPKE